MKLHIDTLCIDLPEWKPSLEGVSEDGIEREYVFYGQMVDKSDLDKATSYQDQEQYRVFVPSKEKNREITARIRKTVSWYKDDKGEHSHDPVYHLTIKSFLKGEKGCSEAESELPVAQGQKLLDVFRLADPTSGMIKRRYVFPAGRGYFPSNASPDEIVGVRMSLGDSVWEVDVPKEFRDPASMDRSEVEDDNCWVKLDFEVKKFNLKVKDNHFDVPFPLRLKNVVYQQPGERDKETEATVKKAMKAFKPEPLSAGQESVGQYIADTYRLAPVTWTILAVMTALNAIGYIRRRLRRASSARSNAKRRDYAKELERSQSEQEKLVSITKRTFLNGDWLDKHHMEMRAVSGRGVIGQLALNGRFPGAPGAVLQAVKGQLQEVGRVVQYLKSKGKAKDPDVYSDFELHPEKLLGQVTWNADERQLDITYPQRTDTIVPLSKIDVPNAADLVIDCMKLYAELEELAQWEKRQHKLPLEWVLADSLLSTARALTRWMGRSVKQADVSTESRVFSLEESGDWGEVSFGEKMKRIFGAAALLAVVVGSVVAVFAAVHYIGKGIEWFFSNRSRHDKATAPKVLEMVDSKIDEAIKDIQSTYLNREWMSDATLATSPISAKSIGGLLSRNGTYSASSLRTNVERHLHAIATVADYYKVFMGKWAREMNRVADWIHREANRMASGQPGALPDVDFMLDKAIDMVEKAGSPWENIPLKADLLLGSVTVDREYGILSMEMGDKGPDTLPPLKADEVNDAARSLILVLSAIRSCAAKFDSVPNVADGEDTSHFDVMVNGEEIWQEMIGQSPLDDVFWHGWRGDAYLYLSYQLMQNLAGTAEALMLLLKRSVLKKQ